MEMKEDPKVLRLMVSFLRLQARMTQTQLGRAAGMTQGHISRYESGQKVPTEEVLRRLARATGVSWPLAVHVRRFCAAFLAGAARQDSIEPGTASGAEPLEQAVLENVRLALSAYHLEGDATET
ncbi:MAG TPA: helix-turn-helix domain-containing protein [Thermoanaerobaculia bacterium]|jgi:transcriptional regulator with XRE-family HTH domain|nr:helix-turn-helix domain-containing protein [Thermoanaerobaculia bacterium]